MVARRNEYRMKNLMEESLLLKRAGGVSPPSSRSRGAHAPRSPGVTLPRVFQHDAGLAVGETHRHEQLALAARLPHARRRVALDFQLPRPVNAIPALADLFNLVSDSGAIMEIVARFVCRGGQHAAERHFLARHYRIGEVLELDRSLGVQDCRAIIACQRMTVEAIYTFFPKLI